MAWLLLAALTPTAPARSETRIALVIANESYTQPGAHLTNTHRDGDLVKAALEKVGFKVWVVRDTASEGALLRSIGEHVERLAKAGPDAVGFFYYTGHGAADRPNGENYLIPTDVPLTHVAQLPLMAVRLEKITATLAGAGKMSFVVFDACRNVSLQRADKILAFKGFAPVREQNGLLVAFATEPGNVAVDEGLYASALADEMVKPGLEASQVFRRVRLRVREDTKRAQSPEYLDKRDYDFHFLAPEPPPPPQISASEPAQPTGAVAPSSLQDGPALNPGDPPATPASTESTLVPSHTGPMPSTSNSDAAALRLLTELENLGVTPSDVMRAKERAAAPIAAPVQTAASTAPGRTQDVKKSALPPLPKVGRNRRPP